LSPGFSFLRGGVVHALHAWDPDGPGPSTVHVAVAGNFRLAGSVHAMNIVFYNLDNASWTPVSSGLNNTVYALASESSGELFAGGRFDAAGETPASRIAKWERTSWASLDAGINGQSLYGLPVLSNNDVIAGGALTVAGGVAANRIRTMEWSELDSNCAGVQQHRLRDRGPARRRTTREWCLHAIRGNSAQLHRPLEWR
jgi:hypothetical protein